MSLKIADDELTWFLPGARLLAFPRPLEHTGEIHALVFGLTRALESLDFPLHEVRSRLIDGQLYLAAVPSARAEADLPRKLQRVHDASLRYTRNIRQGWEQGPRQEAEGYNETIARFETDQTPQKVADGMRPLLRTRGNTWFNAFRSAIAPAALLQEEAKGTLPADAAAVVRDALDVVRERGGRVFDSALRRIGERLAQAGALDEPSEVFWLEWEEIRQTLRDGASRQQLVEGRQAAAAARPPSEPSPSVGATLPPDAPRMYLLREMLALLE